MNDPSAFEFRLEAELLGHLQTPSHARPGGSGGLRKAAALHHQEEEPRHEVHALTSDDGGGTDFRSVG